MQIILQEDEILEALEAYVRDQINISANQEIKIDLKAGRGDNGFSATLDIRKAQTALPAPVAPVCTPVVRISEAVTEESAIEPSAAISTGEDRVDPDAEASATEEASEAAVVVDEAPAPKAGSLFTFAKKKAAE